MEQKDQIALERLLRIAEGDSGQAAKVADFLLAWWNAEECGGFDLTKLWALDASIAADIVAVTGLISHVHQYPDTLGYGKQFARLISSWRAPLIA